MEPADQPSTRLERLAPALLALAAVALYAPTLVNGLTNWDDLKYVVQSPIASQGLGGLRAAWTQPFDFAWYPLTQSVYCLLFAAAGAAAWPYHLAQVLLFAASCALVPAALAACGLERRLALIAAACWLLHPLRVESVSWVANLKDTLSLLGVLVAFALLPRGRALSAVAFTLALLAKSTVFPLAILLAVVDARRRAARWPAALVGSLAWVVPAIAVAVVAAVLQRGSEAGFLRTYPGGSLSAALPSVLYLPWQYAAWALGPHRPQALYDFEPVGAMDGRALVALAAWAAAFVFAWTRRPRAPALLLLGGFALPFLPVTGLVPIAFHVADRYALLPSLAVDTALVLAAAALARRPGGKRWLVVAPAALSLLLVPLTVLRQRDWQTSITLWEADRGRTEQLAARVNLAGAYGGEGRYADAAKELEAVVAAAPRDVGHLSSLVFALAARDGADAGQVLRWVGLVRASRGLPGTLGLVAREADEAGVPSVSEAIRRWLSR